MANAVKVSGLVRYHEDSPDAPDYQKTDASGTYLYPGVTAGSAIKIAPNVFLSAYHVVYGPKPHGDHVYFYSDQVLSIGADIQSGVDSTTGHTTQALRGGDAVEVYDNINNFQGVAGTPDLALFTTAGSETSSADTVPLAVFRGGDANKINSLISSPTISGYSDDGFIQDEVGRTYQTTAAPLIGADNSFFYTSSDSSQGVSGGPLEASINGKMYVIGTLSGHLGSSDVSNRITFTDYQYIVDNYLYQLPADSRGNPALIVGKDDGDTFSGTVLDETMIAGQGSTEIYGSLGNDTYFADSAPASSLDVSFVSDSAADASANASIAQIGQVALTVDIGYKYGNAVARVADAAGQNVYSQTINDASEIVLPGDQSLVSITSTANPQVAGSSQLPALGDAGHLLEIQAGLDGSSNNSTVDLTGLNISADPSSINADQSLTVDLGPSPTNPSSFTIGIDQDSAVGAPQESRPPVSLTGFSTVQLGDSQTVSLSFVPSSPLTIAGATLDIDANGSSSGFTNDDLLDFSKVASPIDIKDGTISGSELTLNSISTIIGSDAGSSYSIGQSTFESDPSLIVDRFVGGAGNNTFDIDYGMDPSASTPVGYTFGNNARAPVILVGGAGANSFDFRNEQNSSLTIVYGGSGSSTYNFEAPSDDNPYVSVQIMHISNFSQADLTNVDAEAFAEQIDNAYGWQSSDTSFDNPRRIVLINPGPNDVLELNGHVVKDSSYQQVQEYINDNSGTGQRSDEKIFDYVTSGNTFLEDPSGDFVQFSEIVGSHDTTNGHYTTQEDIGFDTGVATYQFVGLQAGDFGRTYSGSGTRSTEVVTGPYSPGSYTSDETVEPPTPDTTAVSLEDAQRQLSHGGAGGPASSHASLNNMVQAMATIGPPASATLAPTVTAAEMQPTLAASHG